MNKHLWQRVEPLLAQYEQAFLATCGHTAPHASTVAYRVCSKQIELFVPHVSDHLFNLEARPELVLVTSGWQLLGRGNVLPNEEFAAPHTWQVVVRVQPVRLHILNQDGTGYAETIDFEGWANGG